MVDSPESQPQPVPAAPPAPRGKRRRRPVLLALVAGILWFVGQGLGWFGSGPSGEKGDGDGNARGAMPAKIAGAGLVRKDGQAAGAESPGVTGEGGGQPVAGDPEAAAGTSGASGPANPEAAVPAAGSGETAPKIGASPSSTAPPGAGVSDDRFASLMSLLESHLSEQELGSTSAALQRILKQPLNDAQRAQVASVQERLLPLTKACELRVLQLVQKGEVLAADREASQLVVGGVWRATELLAVAPELALASNWQTKVEAPGTVPMPSPLLRNRKVRVRWRDELRAGVVAGSNRDEVTVRLVSGSGQTFPTVKAVACEPCDSSSSEAVEMGLAAVRAGAPRLARLWMLRAHLLKDELTTRGEQLLKLLR